MKKIIFILLITQFSTIFNMNAQCSANFNIISTGVGSYSFQNTSVTTPTANSFWNFSGMAYSNLTNPTYTFTSNGIYTISLQVSDTLPICVSAITKTLNVTGLPCSVISNFYSTQISALTIKFFNLTTPNTSNINYLWSFGDGGTSTSSVTPLSHVYPAPGNYTVTLIATEGSSSCTSTYTDIVTVSSCSVVSNFTYSIGNNGLVNFTNLSSSSTLTSVWQFGDGTSPSTSLNPVHQYTANGTYSVSLSVFDYSMGFPCKDSIMLPLTINNVTCNLIGATNYITSNNWVGSGGVTFNNSIATASASGFSYNWNFGNGGTSTLSNPTSSYTANGLYPITCTVINTSAPTCSTVLTTTINVWDAVCGISPSIAITNGANGAVSCSNTAITSTVNYNEWEVGDGTLALLGVGLAYNHTFNYNGNYFVKLRMIDSINFCSRSVIAPITITNVPTTGCSAKSYFITDKDLTTPFKWNIYPGYQSNVTAVDWSWGDGTNSTIMFPSHTYSNVGYYSICLTVTLSCGTTTSYCNTAFIYKSNSINNNNSFAPLTVSVLQQVTGLNENENLLANLFTHPNPSNGVFLINSSNNVEVNKIIVTNNIGQVVYFGEQQSKIDISHLNNGVYYATINTNKGNKVIKLLKN